VRSVAFHAGSRLVGFGDWFGAVRLWNLETGEVRVLGHFGRAITTWRSARMDVSWRLRGTISGVVLADHVKNLDWQARRVVFEAKASADVVIDVRERLRVLLGL
jgi:hypothetical protein